MDWHHCNDYCHPDEAVLRFGWDNAAIHAELVAGVGTLPQPVAARLLAEALATTHGVSVVHAVPVPDEPGTWVAYWVA